MLIEELERRVMDLLLAGELPALTRLREQYARASIASREYSGVGVFTNFAVPADVARVTPPNFTISDITYELANVENGGSAVLFIRDGALSMLELYNWTDEWPTEVHMTSLTYLVPRRPGLKEYVPSPHRDLNILLDEITEARSRPASA
jgi:hypothetical protein